MTVSVVRVLGLATLLVYVLGCSPQPAKSPGPKTEAEARRGGVVRIALWQEPALLNTLRGTQTVNQAVSRTMMEGLLVHLPDGQAAPALAAEVPSFENGGVSADGLTI